MNSCYRQRPSGVCVDAGTTPSCGEGWAWLGQNPPSAERVREVARGGESERRGGRGGGGKVVKQSMGGGFKCKISS